MTYERCLIGLHPLKQKEKAAGRCVKESQALFGKDSDIYQLPFTRSDFVRTQPAKQKGMSISGVQPKLSLRMSDQGQLEVTPTSGEYILKPSPEQFPGLAENEHAIMCCMKELDFDIPGFGLIPFAGEDGQERAELAFIIERYDRHGSVKVHQEQLDGAMSVNDKYGLNAVGQPAISYEQAARFLVTNVDGSLQSKREIFKRVVCAYMLGNNDFHLRNIGIIHPENGPLLLAPVYDFVSVVPYPESFGSTLALPLLAREECDQSLADGLDSGIGEYIGYDFLEFARGIGLNENLAKKELDKLLLAQEKIFGIINDSYMSDEHKEKVTQYINRRMMLLDMTDKPL